MPPSKLVRRKANPSAGQVGEGERFLELYGRYRDVVRQELEAEGLSPVDAERLVGAVFKRLARVVRAESPRNPLDATIRTLAREVSAATSPPAGSGSAFPIGPHLTSGG